MPRYGISDEVQEAATKAVELRATGMTFANIGKALGLSTARVHTLLEQIRTTEEQQEVDVMRWDQKIQLETLIEKLRADVEATNDIKLRNDLTRTLVMLYDRQAKLYALDAPQKIDARVEVVRHEVVGVDPQAMIEGEVISSAHDL